MAITEIVVPFTADRLYDRGIAAAVRLAREWLLPIQLISIETIPTDCGVPSKISRDRIDDVLRRLLARFPDIEATTQIVVANDVIQALVEALTPTCIVVMATEEAGVDVKNSHAEQLVQRWSGPIMMIGPASKIDEPWMPVVLPLDGSDLAERVLPVAQIFAKSFGEPIRLIHVVSPEVIDIVASLNDAGEAVLESTYVVDASRRLANPEVGTTWEIIHHEEPAAAIVSFLNRRPGGLVVTSTGGVMGKARELFGSTAMQLVHTSPTPVVIVSPDFPSPEDLGAI